MLVLRGGRSRDRGGWLATTPLEIEARLRRLRGYRALPQKGAALTQGVTKAWTRWRRNPCWGALLESQRGSGKSLPGFEDANRTHTQNNRSASAA